LGSIVADLLFAFELPRLEGEARSWLNHEVRAPILVRESFFD